mmetsp:Transcript_3735/g.9889  ORF Transcript_3735/g.9889 Transcript_3735/m.9889 type:complete len:106 (-) Transcript_3735:560-877(-)
MPTSELVEYKVHRWETAWYDVLKNSPHKSCCIVDKCVIVHDPPWCRCVCDRSEADTAPRPHRHACKRDGEGSSHHSFPGVLISMVVVAWPSRSAGGIVSYLFGHA